MAGNEGLPIRHPRPLTTAEIYSELEKEQEAVVRLSDLLWTLANRSGQQAHP